MFLNNPLRPGSVTTDILHDGAVTLAKTDFLNSAPTESIVYKPPSGSAGLDITANTEFFFTLRSNNNPTGRYYRFYDSDGNLVIDTPGGGLIFNATSGDLHLQRTSVTQLTVTSTGIVLANPLGIASGGTGTSTPSIVAGTGISVGGTWPNQIINNTSNYASLADPLPVAHGGTGTSTPSIVAGTAISIGGTWPNQTINNTSAYASLADPLPVPHGGTGTATPALVAGSNIVLSGTWPNQTIALNISPTIAGWVFNNSTGSITNPSGNGSLDKYLNVLASTGLTGDHTRAFTDTAGNNVMIIHVGATNRVDIINLQVNNKVSYYNGVSTVGVGIPSLVAEVDLTGQSGSISATTIFTPSSGGMYRITAYCFLDDVSGSSISVDVDVTYTINGSNFKIRICIPSASSVIKTAADGVINLFSDATAIKYNATISGFGASDNYDLHIRLEAI